MGKDWKKVRGHAGLYQRWSGSRFIGYAIRFKKHGIWYSKAAGRNLEDAKDELAAERLRARRGELGPRGNAYPVTKLREEYIAQCRDRLRPKTVRRYENALDRILPGLRCELVSEMRLTLLDRYIADRRKGADDRPAASKRTVNTELKTLRAMLRHGVLRGLIASNPLAQAKSLPVRPADTRSRRALTHEEFGRLLDHKHDDGGRGKEPMQRECRCRDLWLLLGHSGMRAGEMVALEWTDVDFGRGLLHVRGTKTPAADRRIPMTKAVAEMLRQRQKQANAGVNLVFTTQTGKPITWNLRTKLQRCLRATKIDSFGVDLHSFRYSFASWLIQAGQSPKTVQRLLGHSTVEMTMRVYAQVMPGDERRAMQVLDSQGLGHAAEFHKTVTDGPGFRRVLG